MLEKLKADLSPISEEHVRLSIHEFRSNLADAFRYTTINKDPIVLTKNGEERAGLVPLEFLQLIDDLSKEFSPGGTGQRISLEELKKEIELLAKIKSGSKVNENEQGGAPIK